MVTLLKRAAWVTVGLALGLAGVLWIWPLILASAIWTVSMPIAETEASAPRTRRRRFRPRIVR